MGGSPNVEGPNFHLNEDPKHFRGHGGVLKPDMRGVPSPHKNGSIDKLFQADGGYYGATALHEDG